MQRFLRAIVAIVAALITSNSQAAPDPCKYTITTPPISWAMDKNTGIPAGVRQASTYIWLLDSDGAKVAKADGSVNFTEMQSALTLMMQKMVAGCKSGPTTYTAHLSWSIPATRADGSALSVAELASYEIYYTMGAGGSSVAVPVSGGTTTSYDISSLGPGAYHFAIAAIDTGGRKSALSTVASISFP